MARPLKTGLDYFYIDTDFLIDKKIEPFLLNFGAKGIGVLTILLSMIYRNGYYLQMDEDSIEMLALKSKIDEDEATKMINYLLKKDFFCKCLYEKYNILTSHGIQKRFFVTAKKREIIKIILEYWICDESSPIIEFVSVSDTDNSVSDTDNSVNAGENPTREKESRDKKEEGSKERKESGEFSQAQNPPIFPFIIPSLTEIMEQVDINNKNSECQVIPESEIKAFSQNYLNERKNYERDSKWYTSRGQPIKNWKENLFKWQNKEKYFSKLVNGNGKNGNSKNGKPVITDEMLERYSEFAESLPDF
jgi:hypothetical protein